MRKIVIIIMMINFFFPGLALTEEDVTVPRFYIDYTVVSNTLMDGKGYQLELMELSVLDQPSADFIAEFWWSKAKEACSDVVKEKTERYAKKITPQTTEKEKEQLNDEFEKECDQCYFSFYCDHWDDINKMILDKLKAARKNSNNK